MFWYLTLPAKMSCLGAIFNNCTINALFYFCGRGEKQYEDSEFCSMSLLIIPIQSQSKEYRWQSQWILRKSVKMVKCDGKVGILLHRCGNQKGLQVTSTVPSDFLCNSPVQKQASQCATFGLQAKNRVWILNFLVTSTMQLHSLSIKNQGTRKFFQMMKKWAGQGHNS